MSMSLFSHPFAMTRLARSILFAGVLAAMSNPLWAQTSVNDYGVHHRGSVIGDDVLYSIGGGRAVSMGPVGQMQSLGHVDVDQGALDQPGIGGEGGRGEGEGEEGMKDGFHESADTVEGWVILRERQE